MTNANHPAPERADAVVHSRAAVVAESVSEEDRSVDVIASTDDIDGHGTILRQNWKLDRFAANPVVLYAHDSRELPIGTASDVGVVDGQLRAKIRFSDAELNPKAEQIWRNVKAKILRGVSVGFLPHSVSFERENDREFVVLDDNELMEISIVPVPSNPATLSQLRARAIEASTPPAPIDEPAPPVSHQPPEMPKESPMSENQNNATPTVARALGLPAGSSESDMLAAASRLRELEVQLMAIATVESSAEALGALRGMKAKADKADELQKRLSEVEAERDKQNFEAQLQRGLSERKLSPETARLEREKFERRLSEGRGAEAVADLKGFVDVAPTLVAQPRQQPAPSGGGSAPALSWNGKSYAELKPIEKHQLWKENRELFDAMKSEAGRAA